MPSLHGSMDHRPPKAARTEAGHERAAAAGRADEHAVGHKAADEGARRRADRLAGEVATLPITAAKDALLREVRKWEGEGAGVRRLFFLFVSASQTSKPSLPTLSLSLSSAPTTRSS